MKRIFGISILAFGFMLMSMAVMAIPAFPVRKQILQPDGTILVYYLKGDEHFHALVTEDGYLVAKSDDGYMYYASVVDNIIVTSDILAHNIENRSESEQASLTTENEFDFNRAYSSQSANSKKRKAQQKKLPGVYFPTEGEMKGIILLVEFADNAFQQEYTPDVFDRMMNKEGNTEYGATGSSHD
jgi:hypothetical protein